MTDFGDTITSRALTSAALKIGLDLPVPRKPVMTAFISRSLNTEDACSVSEEWANSRAMAWYRVLNHPLPSNVGHIRVATVLRKESWWKPAIDGIVISVNMSKVRDPYMIMLIGSNMLEVRDKLRTMHGIKFTIGEKVPISKMPRIMEENTGRSLMLNILILTKNLMRGMGLHH